MSERKPEDVAYLYWTSPDGQHFKTLGAALRVASLGEWGRKSVRLKRIGHHDAVIAPGGPAGWYVREFGDKLPAPRKVQIKYARGSKVLGGRIVKS